MLTHEVPLYDVKFSVCVCVSVPWEHLGLLDYFHSKTVRL